MTDYKWTNPTARKRHRCECCSWDIMPGETYYRIAGLDRSVAWTIKQCEHCARVTSQYSREHYGDEWEIECVLCIPTATLSGSVYIEEHKRRGEVDDAPRYWGRAVFEAGR